MTPGRTPRRLSIRPTAFGTIAAGVAAAVVVARSGINDPALSALVWVAFATLIVVGAVIPALTIAATSVTVTDAPSDVVVGRSTRLGLAVRGPRLIDAVRVQMVGLGPDDGPWNVVVGREGTIEVVWPTRGVHRALDVVVSTDGPLGVVTASRRFVVRLAQAIAVGPVPIHHPSPSPSVAESGADERPTDMTGGSDQVRSVRPYRYGDPAHLVHWPSSARVGSLVVRELEPPVRPSVVIVVDLGSEQAPLDPAAAERIVGEAAGRALDVLRVGGEVVLCTNDEGVPATAIVSDPRRVNRRLAGAGPGTPGEPPAGRYRP